jgi:hypothetical protein
MQRKVLVGWKKGRIKRRGGRACESEIKSFLLRRKCEL